MPGKVVCHPQSVVQRQAAIHFPLVLRVPLKELNLQVHERTRSAFAVTSEISDERVGIRIARVSQSGCESTVGSVEIECACPVSAGGFSVPYIFEINAGLVAVATCVDRKV